MGVFRTIRPLVKGLTLIFVDESLASTKYQVSCAVLLRLHIYEFNDKKKKKKMNTIAK